MTSRALLALACGSALWSLGAAGCVEGLEPAEIGIGRRIGMYPGEASVVLPALTDRGGNLYVATGQPDSTGAGQPGTAHSAAASGGVSDGCPTGEGVRGGARGWVGATDGRGWLWTNTALVQLDVYPGTCETILDRDPVSQGDLVFEAVAPLVDETVAGNFAVAAARLGADPDVFLATLDLGLGVIRTSVELGAVSVLATGADQGAREAAFLVRDVAGTRIVIATPSSSSLRTIVVDGDAGTPTVARQLAFAADGSIVGVLGPDKVLLATRSSARIVAPPFPARGVERDDDGNAYVIGIDGGPTSARVVNAQLQPALAWTLAAEVDTALAAGVIVVDDRSGSREGARWSARAASGGSALVQQFAAPAYAVGARAVLVADPPVDRGGVMYSQLAVIPVGVELP